MTIDGGRAAARLHRQRDLVGSARPADELSTRSTAAADLEARRLRVVDRGDVRRRQPAGAARRAVRGALRPDARPRDRGRLPGDPARRSAGRAHLGRDSRSCCLRRRPSIGLALALDLGVVGRLFPELHALVGCPQEPEWHPEGDVWVHTLQVVDQARTPRRRPAAAAAARDHARRRLPRLRQAGDDRVQSTDGSDRSITRSRASRRPRRFSIG